MSEDEIKRRKLDHVRICLDTESQLERGHPSPASFDGYWFEHDALPEIALEDVDLSVEFMGKKLRAPILVSSMTGGVEEGARINRHLAEGVARAGLGMGVGSQRIALLHPETRASFVVRDVAPDILLFANLGAVQLNHGFTEREATAAVEMIGADGLFLHLNPLQEAVQPGGDTNFRGLLGQIEALVNAVPFPVLIKEVGAGIGRRQCRALWDRGVAAIDVSGTGGTSWAKVEGLRAADPTVAQLGDTFKGWGIPTPIAIREAREAVPEAVLIASGGIRSGLDVAKALALGADVVSVAQPALAAALESGAAVEAVLARIVAELRVACFCVGARSIAELRAKALRVG